MDPADPFPRPAHRPGEGPRPLLAHQGQGQRAAAHRVPRPLRAQDPGTRPDHPRPDAALQRGEPAHWEYTEPDWSQLKTVVTGHGPRSAERLNLRRLSTPTRSGCAMWSWPSGRPRKSRQAERFTRQDGESALSVWTGWKRGCGGTGRADGCARLDFVPPPTPGPPLPACWPPAPWFTPGHVHRQPDNRDHGLVIVKRAGGTLRNGRAVPVRSGSGGDALI